MDNFDIETATIPEMRDYAAEKFGVMVPHNTSKEKVKETIENLTGGDKVEDRVKIKVYGDDKNKQPVFVGVNGKGFAIQRNKEVSVPKSVVGVLQTAIKTTYDPKTLEPSDSLVYPFQVII